MRLRGNNEKETKLCNRDGSRGGAGGAHPLPPTRGPAAFEIAFGAQRNESMPIRR